MVSVQWPPDGRRTSHGCSKNLAREYALHFTNTGTRGTSNGSRSPNNAHPHILKKMASSVAVPTSVSLNGNGNGHASFDEEEESPSHPRGFFADQFEVSSNHASHRRKVNVAQTPLIRIAAILMRTFLARVLKSGDRRTAKSLLSSPVPVGPP